MQGCCWVRRSRFASGQSVSRWERCLIGSGTLCSHSEWSSLPFQGQQGSTAECQSVSFSPLISDDIGPLILMVFFGVLIAAIVYVFIAIPETKGLALEEVDALYKSKVPAWKSASWRPEVKRRAMDKVEGGGERRPSDSTMVGEGAVGVGEHAAGVKKTPQTGLELGHVEDGNLASR